MRCGFGTGYLVRRESGVVQEAVQQNTRTSAELALGHADVPQVLHARDRLGVAGGDQQALFAAPEMDQSRLMPAQ